MLLTTVEDVLTRVRVSLENDDFSGAIAAIESLRAPDQADLFYELEEDEQSALLPRMDPESSADILEEMEDEEAARLVSTLTANAAARIFDEMEPDEAADVLAEMEPEQAIAVLNELEDPEEVRPLLVHADDSAGGLMTPEYLALRRRMTAEEAISALRAWDRDKEDTYDIYVVDRLGALVGVVSLRQLIQAEPHELLNDFMDDEPLMVVAGTDQEEVARLMSRYDLTSLPVVDANGLLIGVITIDDVIDVLEEETGEDIQRMGGAEPLDQPYLDTGVTTIFRKRIVWLLLLFLTETLTGSVLRHFEDEMSAVVALSFFIPLLIGTGGNAGSQTTSTIIHALAVGHIGKRDVWRTFLHELSVGLLLGGVMAAVAYGRALLWHTGTGVALTVAIAILAIVVWANVLGSVLPIIASRLKIDPAVISGPAMSTLVDATGLFIYFTVAGLILSQI